MTQLSQTTVDEIAAIPALQEAAAAAVELMDLWPLTKPEHLDNDAKYGEDLQVRITRQMAQILCGQPITRADAEFVYEGADTIPGVEQSIVDALTAANDAYDGVSTYSEDHDAQLVVEADGMLADCGSANAANVAWSEETSQVVTDILDDAETFIADQAQADGHWLISNKQAVVSQRCAVLVLVTDALLNAVAERTANDTDEIGGVDEAFVTALEQSALPLALIVNELAERLGLPRLCASAERVHGVLASYAVTNGDSSALDSTRVLAEALAPIAIAEWHKHKEDVLWDAAEAKRRSREEDEAKSKAALAAKFAHIKDDSNKEEVEL
ncbi:hypothetical protein D2E26_1187 [Bifidobacterium dolichotidis]|uniref:Uncharacterized protein n=1 Tax=Bifidobacterium dolichotidis TaxID=2306976 RepID=A0A430FQM0_9BIFI|nr:hypothetical protein [Bifidobacterium dolichotidis]RSX55133.1 hypothetical protein D2E26_1187 [Bifidobacterium dolichotidis]